MVSIFFAHIGTKTGIVHLVGTVIYGTRMHKTLIGIQS